MRVGIVGTKARPDGRRPAPSYRPSPKLLPMRSRAVPRSVTVGFVLLVLLIVAAADRGTLPQGLRTITGFPGGDKVGHFLLIGTLAFLVSLNVPRIPARRSCFAVLIGGAVIGVLATVEEVSQLMFSNRTPSWADLASSWAGVILFTALAWRVRQRREDPECTSAGRSKSGTESHAKPR